MAQWEALRRCLDTQIRRLIREEGVTGFLTGMDRGVELCAAELVLEQKEQYPDITLECAIPWEDQAAHWTESWRDRYFAVAAQCDREIMLQTHYTPDCMRRRDRYLIRHSSILLALWDGQPYGVGTVVRYAKNMGRTVWILDPERFAVDRGAGSTE
jgi:uncharacterized phage-like protein YoqJ